MLSIYAKWKGTGYLKDTLQNVVERLMLTSKELSLELDPTKVDSPEELQTNAEHLQIVARVFIENICSSSSSIPASFRKICSIVGSYIVYLSSAPAGIIGLTRSADLGLGPGEVSRRKVHCCRRLHILALLLPCNRCARG
jgi:hypothetical protein